MGNLGMGVTRLRWVGTEKWDFYDVWRSKYGKYGDGSAEIWDFHDVWGPEYGTSTMGGDPTMGFL